MTTRWVIPIALPLALAACAVAASPTVTPPSPTGAASAVVGAPMNVDQIGTYFNVTPAQLAEMLKHKDFYFVNVHVPYEGELEQTDAFIPFQSTDLQLVTDYPTDEHSKIVLYCRSGRMSTIVAGALVRAGYTNVWNLDGGFQAWEAAGFSLIHK